MTFGLKCSSDGLSGSVQISGTDVVSFGANSSGQLAPFRNRIINGAGLITQRGSISVTAGGVYCSDRWIHYLTGATGITATGGQGSITGALSSYCIQTSGTWTTGKVGFQQRIESYNCYDLKSKKVTVSGYIYHDIGSDQAFNISLSKANTLDTFSTVTLIDAAQATSGIPSGVATYFSKTFQLGASDAVNGIALNIESVNSLTVTSKTVKITDIQVEAGSIATPFEVRSISNELALCQRYFQWVAYNMYFYAYSVLEQHSIDKTLIVEMRTKPTISTISIDPSATQSVSNNNANAGSTIYSDRTSILCSLSATTTGYSQVLGYRLTASAEL